MSFADVIVLVAKSRDEVNAKLEDWRVILEGERFVPKSHQNRVPKMQFYQGGTSRRYTVTPLNFRPL